jgi:hypothetical protein
LELTPPLIVVIDGEETAMVAVPDANERGILVKVDIEDEEVNEVVVAVNSCVAVGIQVMGEVDIEHEGLGVNELAVIVDSSVAVGNQVTEDLVYVYCE